MRAALRAPASIALPSIRASTIAPQNFVSIFLDME
jgi:hypothetical protein